MPGDVEEKTLSKEAQKQIDQAREEDELTSHKEVKENLGLSS